MRRIFTHAAVALVAVTSLAATCSTAPREITEERAIAIARAHATFEIVSVRAERRTDEGRRVWHVTMQGNPVSPEHPLLRPIVIVLIDRQSGEVVSIAKS